MSHTFPLVRKEFRALFPIWAGCVLSIAAGLVSTHYLVLTAGALALTFGFVTLGAQSFGHEYSHRTLGMLLAQPADRRRLFAIKYGVLALSASIIVGIAWMLSAAGQDIRDNWVTGELILLATGSAVFLAPWFSILCRSTLAGAVFAVAVPGLLAVAGDFAGTLLYGLDRAADIDQFKNLVLWRGMVAACVIATVGGWLTFLRLEAIEGPGTDLQLPQSIVTDTSDDVAGERRHPIRLLINKEIRLQQLTFIVVALYVLGWLAVTWTERPDSTSHVIPVEPLALMYAGFVSLLIGALASAEERQYGTLESQLLLPVPAWQQWLLKSTIVLGLAALLGGLLPALLFSVSPPASGDRIPARFFLGGALPVAAIGLYASSLATSGVRALLGSLPLMPALVMYVRMVEWGLYWIGETLLGKRLSWSIGSGRWMLQLLAAGLVPLLLVLAFRNHRSLDRSPRALLTQACWILGYLTAFVTLLWL